MTFDSKLQRQIFGRLATGITVVTTVADGQPWGMTANAVTSLSLDPPLVLVAVGKHGKSAAKFKAGDCFAVNILRDDQEPASRSFATDGQAGFAEFKHATAVTGAPIFETSLGYVDCRLKEILPGGDHDIFVGEIVAGESRDGQPLLYFAGKYAQLAAAP